MAVGAVWLGSALSGSSGVGKALGTSFESATVAGGSVAATVGVVVDIGVVVNVMAGTVGATEVFKAGSVTANGRGVLVSKA